MRSTFMGKISKEKGKILARKGISNMSQVAMESSSTAFNGNAHAANTAK